jgi:hypothetical protein
MCSNVPNVVEKDLQKGINQGSLKSVDFIYVILLDVPINLNRKRLCG